MIKVEKRMKWTIHQQVECRCSGVSEWKNRLGLRAGKVSSAGKIGKHHNSRRTDSKISAMRLNNITFDLMSSKVIIRIVGKINRKGAWDMYTTHVVQDIKKLDSFDGMCTMSIHSPSSNSSGSYRTQPKLHHYKSWFRTCHSFIVMDAIAS